MAYLGSLCLLIESLAFFHFLGPARCEEIMACKSWLLAKAAVLLFWEDGRNCRSEGLLLVLQAFMVLSTSRPGKQQRSVREHQQCSFK